MNVADRIDIIVRHINHVRDDCLILGERLIRTGEEDFGRGLIANGYKHDVSKFSGIEFEFLNAETKKENPDMFECALKCHQTQNKHHPEYWLEISEMPRIYLAEFCCDVKARSSEFGTDIMDWVKENATKKYKFSTSSKTYKQIKEFMDLLLENQFK
jgi:hypothetical protein